MLNVSNPRHPLLTPWKPSGFVLEAAPQPFPVTTRAVFEEQLDDPDYITLLDDLAYAYGYLTD